MVFYISSSFSSIAAVFRAYDIDGDGSISREEMSYWVKNAMRSARRIKKASQTPLKEVSADWVFIRFFLFLHKCVKFSPLSLVRTDISFLGIVCWKGVDCGVQQESGLDFARYDHHPDCRWGKHETRWCSLLWRNRCTFTLIVQRSVWYNCCRIR